MGEPCRGMPGSTVVCGKRCFQASQVVTVEGMNFSLLPLSGPCTAVPVTCTHRESVPLSYITKESLISIPACPKRSVLPSSLRSYTIDDWQSGHQDTAIGIPPTVSFPNS